MNDNTFEIQTLIIMLTSIYLLISLSIAVHRIHERIKWENYMSDVPYGDWEYYAPKVPLFDATTYIFFPAGIMIWGWLRIAHVINKIFY